MRKQKTITIKGGENADPPDRTFTVFELTARQIMPILQPEYLEGKTILEAFELLRDELLPKASTMKPDDFLDLAPSEIEQVWNAFQEVNATFFTLSSRMGKGLIGDLLATAKPMLISLFGGFVADYLRRVMSPVSITDSAISSPQPTKTNDLDLSNSDILLTR